VFKKYKSFLVLIFAAGLLNIFVFFWYLPNLENKAEYTEDQIEQEKFDIEATLKNIEQSLIELNTRVENQQKILENLRLQQAIDDVLLTIE
jgi:lipopolysaccharide export LptBFGC system permease protein LptF